MKKVWYYFKSLLCAPFILHIFNLMATGLDISISINILTIVIVGILRISGLIMLVVYYIAIL